MMAPAAELLLGGVASMVAEGLVTGRMGNASVRAGTQVIITPTNVSYASMGMADLVAIDLEGQQLEGRHPPSSEHRLHLAVYRERPDVGAVVHTHSVFATAWSYGSEPLGLGSEDMLRTVGGAADVVAASEGGSPQLATAVGRALRDREAVLLGRHGVVGVGPAIDDALDVCRVVEREAHVAWLLSSDRSLTA
jgi:L-fuculose-phosphate aldolase